MGEHCAWCNITESEKKYLLVDSRYWQVFLADKQDYIGRCILVLKRHCGSLPQLNDEEWAALKEMIEQLETAITNSLGADMFNWSCLMNDSYKVNTPNPHLHIHVRPRYKAPVSINGKLFYDEDFAHHYKNRKQNKLAEAEKESVYRLIRKALDLTT